MSSMAGEHIQRVTLPLEAEVRAAAEEEARIYNTTVKAVLVLWLRKSQRTFARSVMVLPCERCGDDCMFGGVTPPQRKFALEQWESGLFRPLCETCLEASEEAG